MAETDEPDLYEEAERLGIKYFLVSYVPLNADSRVSMIPKSAIRNVQRSGCGIPAAMFFKADGADPEMYLVPDPKSLVQLPWKRDYGWLASNIYMNGEPYSQCPRRALIRQTERALRLGYVMKSGVEPEFTLLTKDGSALGDPQDAAQPMSLQDPLATLRMAPVLTKIHDTMEELGWQPYEIDHEASSCQYEVNFGFTDALTLADRHAFMKFMIKDIADQAGYRATFMPIPLPNLLCANGLHVNVSLWNAVDGTNAFEDSTDPALGLSETAYHFIGGVLKHVRATCAMLCPTINSYRRLNQGSWCPTTVSWGGNNRTVLLRVPASNRVEHRLPDGSGNPYLIQAVILASGLDGLDKKIVPGKRCDVLVTDFKEPLAKMPTSLQEAMSLLRDSHYLRHCLGNDLVDGFLYMKTREWEDFMKHFSKWEQDYYLNC